MAHKKAPAARNGRDSNAQRLGVKRYGGQTVLPWQYSRASARTPGNNVGRGGDDTLFALINGVVTFERKIKPARRSAFTQFQFHLT